MASVINASSSGAGGLVSSGDSSGVLQLQNNGSTSVTLDTSGNVGIGTTSPVSKLNVNGGSVTLAETTTGAYNIDFQSRTASTNARIQYDQVTNTTGQLIFYTNGGSLTERMRIASNGVLTSLATYNNISGGSPNMFVQTDGTIYRGTSALKYKQNVRDLELIDINKFRAVRYKSKCENDDQTVDYFGVIADEVDTAGIKELVTYGADGEVENFQYDRFTVVLLKAIQEQQALITAQAETINALTARIVALEAK